VTVTSTDTGRAAEQAAAGELSRQGFKILAQNWKTKLCEIDIIAQKDGVVWFVEVKYRSTIKFGDGLEYIGRQKLVHLQRAASLWSSQHNYNGEITLGAISVSGNNIVEDMVEI